MYTFTKDLNEIFTFRFLLLFPSIQVPYFSVVGILLNARTYLSGKCLLDLYHSFAYPYLTYCVELWGHLNDTVLGPIFLLQKKMHTNNIIFIFFSSQASYIFKI